MGYGYININESISHLPSSIYHSKAVALNENGA